MERFNSFNDQPQEDISSTQLTMQQALSKNPQLVEQAFNPALTATPSEFTSGNQRIKEENFAGVFGELAGFDDSQESQEVATNALAFVDLTARLHGREFDGLSGFDSLFVNGEPVSTQEVDNLVNNYLDQSPAVNQMVEQYVEHVDPEKVNPDATKRLLATGFYLVDETLDAQEELDEQAEFNARFDSLIEAETQQADINNQFDEMVQHSLPSLQSQDYFDQQFANRMHDEYPGPMEDYNQKFSEMVEEVKVDGYIDNRTPKEHQEAFDDIAENFSVTGETNDSQRLTYASVASELAKEGIKAYAGRIEKRIERNGDAAAVAIRSGGERLSASMEASRRMARAAFNFWTVGYQAKRT